MGHIALYRKWRPQVFEDLVGQEHISRTLINAIETNRVSHAYLFCGSRGTGKTTTARLLAKSLNCEARIDGSPCNKCPSCNDLTTSSSLDVIEIDAASNRGISEIKNIIEQVRFASVSGKYKVYIIDEFHMLTTEAFNAILKTLEEPPPKVVFVLATTEAHKILPTIISRCQRFDFQRITVSILVKRLKYIATEEGIKISDDSLLSIARKANGGLRDALSLLDQLSSFSSGEGEIPTELVYQVLGMVSTDFLSKLAEAIAQSEPVKIMEIISELLKAGNDAIVIMTETINFFRHLLVVKSAPDMAEYLEVPIVNLQDIKRISTLFSSDDILNHLQFLSEAIERVKKTQQAQLWLEVNFVQLCKKKKIPDLILNNPQSIPHQDNIQTPISNSQIDELLKKISLLEKRLESLSSGNIIQMSAHNQSRNEATKQSINNQPANTKQEPINVNNMDFSNIWERILHETKKKSIPAAAVLQNGMLSNIDAKIHTVTVTFENEGFIELLKRSKYQKVEQALSAIFGSPYKLVMEKGSLSKTEKKNFKVNPDIKNLSDPETENILDDNNLQRPETTLNSIVVQDNEDKSKNIILNKDINSNNFSAKIDQTQTDYSDVMVKNTITEDLEIDIQQSLGSRLNIEPESFGNDVIPDTEGPDIQYQIKEQTDSYFIKESGEQSEPIFAPAGIKKRSEKELYFNDVADVFKGKIINKVKN